MDSGFYPPRKLRPPTTRFKWTYTPFGEVRVTTTDEQPCYVAYSVRAWLATLWGIAG